MAGTISMGARREGYPDQFGKKQHSIVQRLLRALRRSAAQRLTAETAGDGYETFAQPPGAVDGSGYAGPDPAHSPSHCASPQHRSIRRRLTPARLVTFSDEAIRGSILDAD